MYEYISGILSFLSPTYVAVECGGIAYRVLISLNTYSDLEKLEDVSKIKLYLHHVVREDANLLYGFYSEQERSIFRLLINVSGVGPSTGIMVVSSLRPNEIGQAILTEDINTLKSVKGIGLKTAQRIIVDLKDKITTEQAGDVLFSNNKGYKNKEEALSALVALGFSKNSANKTLEKLVKENSEMSIEELIKTALKKM